MSGCWEKVRTDSFQETYLVGFSFIFCFVRGFVLFVWVSCVEDEV